MTFTELRDRLVGFGFTRKEATLGVRWAKDLETESSLFRTSRWEWELGIGESNMSQKVSSQHARQRLVEASELARECL